MKWQLFKPTAKPVAPPKVVRPKFHAVEIVSVGACCQAARQAREVRFLSSEGPPVLPLAACDFPAACRCKYRHHDDRRIFQRRAGDQVWGTASPVPAERERRQAAGRRTSDRQAGPL